MTWWNDYVGIPYASRGRDRAGIDCWGLARLVYREQFDRDLPSFDGEYVDEHDREANAELIARRVEGWQRLDGTPEPGDLVLFWIADPETKKRHLSHIGIAAAPGHFLHARQGTDSTIERLDAGVWKHRVEGFYRYTPTASGQTFALSAMPHPLRTQQLHAEIPAGLTLAGVRDWMREHGHVPEHIPHRPVMMLDGRVIPAELLDKTVVLPGQRVEYRAVPLNGRAVLSLVTMAVAWWAAPMVVGALGGAAATATSAAVGVGGLSYSASIGVAAMSISMVGGLLANAIFPVRPPKQNNPGTAESMNFLQGGQNQARPYGAIPVVLGRFRFTPPAAAIPYTEANATTSYLRLVLLWGYGPLQISDLRVGATPLESLEEVEYETLTGWDDTTEDVANFNRLYGTDVSQEVVNIKLESDGTDAGSPWTSRVIGDECDRITVTLHFPEGLRQMPIEGGNAGKIYEAAFVGQVQVRQLDADTLEPLTGWGEINAVFRGQTINLQPAWFNVDNDAELEPVYRWTRISLDEYNNLIVRNGAFTANPSSEPSGMLLQRQQEAAFGVGMIYNRLPDYGPSEEPLWDICMYGNTVYQTVDRRGSGTAGVTGCDLSISGYRATIASGTLARAQVEAVNYGKSGQPYHKRKDAFSTNISFSVPRGVYEVRARRRNTSEKEFTTGNGNKVMRYHDAYLYAITGYENRRPVVNPPSVKLAMTAIRIKATNQLNGSLDGITGTVQVICKDWDHVTQTWITRPTRNPASLIRHVLQHPGNARRCPDSAINLTELADFHDYCRENGFMYDGVMAEQQSVDDVLRDIAAAGRASPTRRDGKWTVIIDRPRTVVAQHFTPHNSWGFEGVKTLPRMPHAFRVQFKNAEKGYQDDEMIVYNDGYSSANATLFEGLQLPGVTTKEAVFKHARFHLAQIKLRPETYTLNADIEHIICTRGDLVRVTHFVPMWGIGTGRIKERASETVLQLDEQVPMDAGQQYTIRIRLEDGSSITRTVEAVAEDGYYGEITLTSGVTADEGKPGNLFMFGALEAESVELIVQNIEPAANMNARLTLVDYSPAIYDSDSEPIPDFDSQITRPPVLLIPTITETPVLGTPVSDESVMVVLAPGRYQYRIKLPFSNLATLPTDVTHIEGQIAFAGATDWETVSRVPLAHGAVFFADVQEGDEHQLRLRYVDGRGRTGPWTEPVTHTVVGKTAPPPFVDRFKLIEQPGGIKQFFWQMENPPADLFAYEVRYSLGTTLREWDRMIPLFAKDHRAQQHENVEPAADGVYTFAIRAFDDGGRGSEQPHYITEVLDGDQFGAVLKIVLPHEDDWPGAKTDCYVSGTSLIDSGVLTWDALDVTWDETEETWNNTPASPIIYEHPAVDLGASLEVTIRANSLAAGTTLIEISTSDDDLAYSEWAEVPNSSVTARYFKFRWTVSGTSPLLYRAQAIFYT